MKRKYVVPYRIVTSRTVLRCWDVQDAKKMQEAINISIDSLRPWMPWAKNEPSHFSTKIAAIQNLRDNFDLGIDFVYGIFTEDEDEVIGSYGLEILSDDLMEIGCWISANFQNQGYSTETTKAVIKTGFEVCGLDKIQISFNSENKSSLRVAEKAGFRVHDAHKGADKSDLFICSLSRDDYLRSDLSSQFTIFYDSMGKEIKPLSTGV